MSWDLMEILPLPTSEKKKSKKKLKKKNSSYRTWGDSSDTPDVQEGPYLYRILQNKIQTNAQTKAHSGLIIRSLDIPGSILLLICCVILSKSFPLSLPWFLF